MPECTGVSFNLSRENGETEMSKNLENKKVVVSEIVEKFKEAKSVMFIRNDGLNVQQVTELRKQCREQNVEYVVLKNTLVRRALNELNIEGFDEALNGPNAFAFGMQDVVAPAKVVTDFIEKSKTDRLSIHIGLMGTEVLDEKGVKALASMPSREVLLGRLVGSLNSSISKFVFCLEAIRKQKAGEE